MNNRHKKYYLQKLKNQQLVNRIRQQNYNNRFSIVQKKKFYNALQDPHASYYFVSQSVRNHLKNIKQATISQTTNSLEKQRLKNLFNQKIRLKKRVFFNKKESTSTELIDILTNEQMRKTSIKTVHSNRKKSPRRWSEKTKQEQENIERVNRSMQNRKYKTISQEIRNEDKTFIKRQQIQSDRLNRRGYKQEGQKGINNEINGQQLQSRRGKSKYERKNQKNHRKLISFIEQKKRLLEQLQQKIKGQDKQIQRI